MKAINLLPALVLALLLNTRGTAQYEEAAIKEVIREAYENGYHNEGVLRNLELGFSPEFRSVEIKDGVPVLLDLGACMADVEANHAKGVYPRKGQDRRNLFYHRLEIDGNIAHVKLNLKQGGETIAVEYLELFKSPGGWLILSITTREL